MSHPLEAGTIRILRSDGSTAGTGFLVSKRLAVTCAHVVKSSKVTLGETIKFKFLLGNLGEQKAKVLESGWSTEDDVAILELIEEPFRGIYPMNFQSSRAVEGKSFQGLGYPDNGPVEARWFQGKIGGKVNVEGYANQLLQIQGEEVDQGLSGSAIIDPVTEKVIGMLTAYFDTTRSTAPQVRFAYAIPVETILKVCPEIREQHRFFPPRSPLVEGIHLLPYDYAVRIQNFLTEYLGTPEQREPFGGRESELQFLDEWLKGETQRLLLTAPAGRGKSALLVCWLDSLIAREDLALTFIPVSVRFRTNLASTFFASLAARLAYLHGEDVPTSVETATDTWRVLVDTYLTRAFTEDKKLLVVLDGLDEAADWEATFDLIPSDLPKNVRVVVSARSLVGDVDAKLWLSHLGWERKGKASTLYLPPLNSNGIADVLLHMGIPLDELSRRIDIIVELHRLSEGDPLLVKLYVEELTALGLQASKLTTEDLQSLRPGYEGYFDHWWNDQKKLWGKEAPLREKSIRLIFSFLCGALGGISKDELISLDLDNVVDTFAIEDAFDALKRFVISMPDDRAGNKTRFVLTHPKLHDYFWYRLTEKERIELENRYVSWGDRILQAMLDEKLKPADAPSYLIQYYGAHLERVNASLDKYLKLVEYPSWHQAWFAYEGAYGGYLRDVKRLWKRCCLVDHDAVEDSGKASLLGIEIRCALVESSLHNIANNVFPQLLAQLVQYKIWPLQQGLVTIRQMSDPSQQLQSITSLIPQLTRSQLLEVVATIRLLQEKWVRAEALTALAHEMPELIEEALEEARAERSDWVLVGILGDLVNLKPEIVDEALVMAREMQNKDAYAHFLSKATEYLPELAKEALSVTRQIQYEAQRASTLCSLAKRIPEEYIEQVVSIAREISDNQARATALSFLARYLPELVDEAFAILEKVAGEERGRVISVLTENLPQQYLVSVLNVWEKQPIEIGFDVGLSLQRGRALSALAKRLPSTLLPRVMALVPTLDHQEKRAETLSKLVQRMPEDRLSELLMLAQLINNEKYRAGVLSSLAGKIAEETLEDILLSARLMKDDGARAQVLSALAQRKPELTIEALRSAKTLQDESGASKLLSAIMQFLPELTIDVIFFALKTGNEKNKMQSFRKIAERLPLDKLPELLNVLPQVEDEETRIAILRELAKRVSEQKEYLLPPIKAIQDKEVRADLLSSLSKYLSDEEIRDVITVIKGMNKEWWRARLASDLIQQRPEFIREALEIAQEIKDNGARSMLLTNLAKIMPELVNEALSAAREIEDESQRVIRMGILARYRPEISQEVLTVASSVKDESIYRLKTLAECLPTEHSGKLLNLALQINDEQNRAHMLYQFPKWLLEKHYSVIREAADNFEHKLDRLRVLSAIADFLPEQELEEVVKEAKTAPSWFRSEILNRLIQPLLKMPKAKSYSLLKEYLNFLARKKREDIYTELDILLPLISEVANHSITYEIYMAVKDVAAWWP